MTRVLVALAAALLCAAVGCGNAVWFEYRDDPYLAQMARAGGPDVVRALGSMDPKDRQMALRIVADGAGNARRRGSLAEADKLEALILERYDRERDTAVRACIVRICAPLCGRGSTRMAAFLRARIAAGEFVDYAAVSLASLQAPGALADIDPLTRHPSPEVRYAAATALVVLADPAGIPSVQRVLGAMERAAGWPQTVDGVALGEARQTLQERAQRVWPGL